MIEKKEEVFGALKRIFSTYDCGCYPFSNEIFNVLKNGEKENNAI